MQPSEQIKSKLDIIDVLREYIQVKPAGMNFRALCPFHKEKSPSFMISPEKQIWHCFGCGKGGDIFAFVMEIEGVSFSEALRILAPKAGVDLKREDPALSSQRNRLLDILDLSAKYYNKVLTDAKAAEPARKYLEQRGLTDETIMEWRIGCSPDSWDDLINFLKSRGYKEKEIFLAGMSVQKEGTNRYYNRFRGRIMFPISDLNGNIVAFTARVSPEREATEKMGKYINSPQTQIYDKGRILFGLNKAKGAIREYDKAILVEGQMDVITAHQHGYKNVIAASGTALTAEQIKTIQRYTSNIAFALDADVAGQNAIDRGDEVAKESNVSYVSSEDRRGKAKTYLDPALSYNLNIKVIEIPGGKDPDECIRKDPDAWKTAVANAKPIMQYYFDKVFARLDPKNVEHKREATKKLLPKIAKLASKVEEDHWVKRLAEKIDISEEAIRSTLNQSRQPTQTVKTSVAFSDESKTPRATTREEKLGQELLALLLRFSFLIDIVLNDMQMEYLVGEKNRELYKNIVMYYNNSTHNLSQENGQYSVINYNDFKRWLEENNQTVIFSFLNELSLIGERDFYEYDDVKATEAAKNYINLLHSAFLSAKRKDLERKIAQAETNHDNDLIRELMEELQILTLELRDLT